MCSATFVLGIFRGWEGDEEKGKEFTEENVISETECGEIEKARRVKTAHMQEEL